MKNKHRINFFKQEDYRRTVTEIDEKEYISLKIIVSELRNQYVCCGLHYLSASIYTCLCSESRITDMFACFQVTLHDMILKNIEKIKRPRSSNADALYWCSSSCLCIHPPHPTPSAPSSLHHACWATVAGPRSAGLQLDIHLLQYNQDSPIQRHSFYRWTHVLFCLF